MPPDAKDDVQLQLALDLMEGTKTDAHFPPDHNQLSPDCSLSAKRAAQSNASKNVPN